MECQCGPSDSPKMGQYIGIHWQFVSDPWGKSRSIIKNTFYCSRCEGVGPGREEEMTTKRIASGPV